MSADINRFIVKSLAEMNYDTSEISDETPLGPSGLDLESLALAEIAIQVEDEYGVRIDEDETEQLALMTLGELAAEIARRASLTQAGGK
ncbi:MULTISPECIES: acyl carrier protein [Kitasatospora]|uniref:acyl carrier protein n=1 Tax=Kitasatospora TaxID=2063 RepID=UPI0004C46538|nr:MULTISPECIES: phosphopantetheine-binding protein [unclassified Kitasatospora]WAL74717.1 phosphopantetheine-binding protein [Kitasatospora sp. YST-16]WNW40771.1 phosphopantetheine-binding protein [Streptomyces sp. Li-HN-5-13]